MSLRKKTLLIILVTLGIIFGILFGLSQWLLLKSYQELETQKPRHTADQAKAAFRDQVDNLLRSLNDWSRWDDSHQYALDANEDYKTSNLHENTFETLRLNHFSILNTSGTAVWESGYDIPSVAFADPAPLGEHVAAGKLLRRETDEKNEGIAGIIMLQGQAWLVASRPLLKSDGTGPISGTMVWARRFNEAEINSLAEKTRLSVSMLPVGPGLPADYQQALQEIQGGTAFPALPQDESTINGYALLNDIYGQPALLIKVAQLRDIHAQGKETLKYLLISLVFCGLIFGAVIILLLDREVLSRLLQLAEGVKEVDEQQDLSRRMPINGKDEIASLAGGINQMLAHLAESQEALHARNRETADILDNVGQGILTVGPDLIINAEHSAFADQVFGFNPAGEYLPELLYTKEDRRRGFIEWAGLFFTPMPMLSGDALLNLADKEIKIEAEGSTKVLQLEYRPIADLADTKTIKKLMLVVSDITRQREMEQTAQKEKEEHEQIVKILRDQDNFFSFLYNAKKILEDSKGMLDTLSHQHAEVVSALFRGMHTIKGTAAAFSIKSVSSHSHRIENVFAEVQKGAIPITDELINQLRQELAQVFDELEQVVKKVSELLGEPFGAGHKVFKIREDKLNELQNRIDEVSLSAEASKTLHQEVKKLLRIPVGRAFRMYGNNIEALAERTGKIIAPLEIKNSDLELDLDLIKTLDAPLMHLLRNAVDHGIESPEDRQMLGKNEEGKISLDFILQDGKLLTTLQDDGQGIDPDRLRSVALERGVITPEEAQTMSDEDAVHLIFRPSFSTKKEATDISGRGVGMDVVKTELESHGGLVKINSIPGEGTTFTLILPLHHAS